MSSSVRRSWLGRRAFGCVCFLSIWHQRRCFPPKRSASRVLADRVQLTLLHMNLLNEIPIGNQALVSSEKAEVKATMLCPDRFTMRVDLFAEGS